MPELAFLPLIRLQLGLFPLSNIHNLDNSGLIAKEVRDWKLVSLCFPRSSQVHFRSFVPCPLFPLLLSCPVLSCYTIQAH